VTYKKDGADTSAAPSVVFVACGGQRWTDGCTCGVLQWGQRQTHALNLRMFLATGTAADQRDRDRQITQDQFAKVLR